MRDRGQGVLPGRLQRLARLRAEQMPLLSWTSTKSVFWRWVWCSTEVPSSTSGSKKKKKQKTAVLGEGSLHDKGKLATK